VKDIQKDERCMQHRLKPERHMDGSSFGYSGENLNKLNKLKSISKSVAKALSSIREPQLCDNYEVGTAIGMGREGIVRPCWLIADTKKQASSKILNSGHAVVDVGDLGPVDKKSESYLDVTDCGNSTRKKAAVKSLDKLDTYSRWRGSSLRREVNVLKNLKPHPNIIQLYDVFESPIKLHIVLQMCEGGDLFSYLSEHNFEKQNEKDVARVTLKLLTAVCAVHEQGFVHRDIKLENVMRTENGNEMDAGEIVLIDFGHAKRMPKNSKVSALRRPVGSPSYAAPEVVLEKQFHWNSDIWSIGVVLYILLQGYLPYPHLQRKKWRQFTLDDYVASENDPFCYEGDWQDISSSSKNFSESLLKVDPEERLNVHQALEHPWFKEQGYMVVRDANNLPIVKSIADDENVDFFDVQNIMKKKFSFM